jgi:dTMP kinase
MLKKVRGLGLGKSYPGKLFVVEGCDGSGKSTQIYLLKKWLESKGYIVFFTEWNSSELIKESMKKRQKEKPADTYYLQPYACKRLCRQV